jgi:hypothetical protein
MTVKLILKPHKTNIDVIEIQDIDFYPSALVHIDTFWVKGIGADRGIHDALSNGETVTVELKRIIDPCLDPQ